MTPPAAQSEHEAPKRVFRRRHRLPSNVYAQVFEAKLRKSRGPITVHLRVNEVGEHRLGLSIGRKFGNAVKRGRFKRMMREVFRLNRTELPIPGEGHGYDIVVTARGHEQASLEAYTDWVLEAIEAAHRVHVRRSERHDG